jgi:hypothetical protein
MYVALSRARSLEGACACLSFNPAACRVNPVVEAFYRGGFKASPAATELEDFHQKLLSALRLCPSTAAATAGDVVRGGGGGGGGGGAAGA